MSHQHVAPHPFLGCAASMAAALDGVGDLDPMYLSGADKRTALLELGAVVARTQALVLRVLAAGQALGDVAGDDGSRDAAAWWAHHGHLDPSAARRDARLAAAVSERWTGVGVALRAGRIDPARAEVVVRALDALPDHLDADLRRRAEASLVTDAERFDPRRLRVLGRRVLAHVAPEVADAHEAAQLARDDARADATTYLRTRRRGDGTVELRARISELTAHRLLTYLHAFTSPRRAASGEAAASGAPAERRPHDEQLGRAFAAFLESADPDRMPLHGGDATTVIVTVDLATLRGDLAHTGVALVGEEPISAAQARRLACTAGVVPAVLGGPSQVLDLGRTRRLFGPPQRKAMAIRFPTCATDGCDIPAAWCEAHHARAPWSQGGRTDLADGALLCSRHHHLAHDPRYDTSRHTDGSFRFHRRT